MAVLIRRIRNIASATTGHTRHVNGRKFTTIPKIEMDIAKAGLGYTKKPKRKKGTEYEK